MARTDVRLVVDGADTVLAACEGHTDWLRGYSQEDSEVTVIDTRAIDCDR